MFLDWLLTVASTIASTPAQSGVQQRGTWCKCEHSQTHHSIRLLIIPSYCPLIFNSSRVILISSTCRWACHSLLTASNVNQSTVDIIGLDHTLDDHPTIMAESISLEETNAIRIKAGLAPLAPQAAGPSDPNAEVELDPDQVAEENYRVVREKAAKEKAEK
jgi:hypothetical protein